VKLLRESGTAASFAIATIGLLAVIGSGVVWAYVTTAVLVRVGEPPGGYEPYNMMAVAGFFYLALLGFPCAAIVTHAITRIFSWSTIRSVVLVNVLFGILAGAVAVWSRGGAS
jgi:hypothetical protein